MTRKALGRGLSALIPGVSVAAPAVNVSLIADGGALKFPLRRSDLTISNPGAILNLRL